MKKILTIMEEELKQAFSDCGYEEKYAKAVLSNRPDLCEYQCNGAMADLPKPIKRSRLRLRQKWQKNYPDPGFFP